ncbi:MAG TPA: energy transducer TonB [Bacteroidia bacterium]|nr:energy transducer TonB [Bacteroidia bacterium]
MKKLLFILTILFPLFAAAQTDIDVQEASTEKTSEQEVFDIVEEQPSYPGGEDSMRKFIRDNLVYPDSAINKGLQGSVFLQFVVEPDGKVTNAKAIRSFDEDCAKEAIRVVNLMKWLPGKHRGKAVRVRVVLPIKFKLG